MKKYFCFPIAGMMLLLVLAVPVKPQGQELSWQMVDGQCVFGTTQTPPAPCRKGERLGANWRGASLAR